MLLCVACLMSARSLYAAQIVVNGSITTTDLYAHDAGGPFLYDVYDLTVTQPSTITVSMHAGPNMFPWVGLWGSAVLPADDFAPLYPSALQYNNTSTAMGDLIALSPFVAHPGVTYQVAASPLEYLPTAHLDAYQLTIDYDTPAGTVTLVQVPEPAGVAVIALGAAQFPLARRRRPAPSTTMSAAIT